MASKMDWEKTAERTDKNSPCTGQPRILLLFWTTWKDKRAALNHDVDVLMFCLRPPKKEIFLPSRVMWLLSVIT
jgi:hypothetical protein